MNRITLLFVVIIYLLGICESQKNFNIQKWNNCNKNAENTVALILARGGSKGIKLKNLSKIGNLSLLGRSISIIKNSRQFSDIWVSTDHQNIAFEALKFGAKVHHRSKSTSQDTTPSIESVQEFLIEHREIENVALVQCTSPFVREEYLEKAYQLFCVTDCVFSVVRSFKLRWLYDDRTSKLEPLNFDYKHRPRRQDWNGEFIESGMFYFATRNLLTNGLFQNENCKFVEINPLDALEIDSYYDLELANKIVSQET